MKITIRNLAQDNSGRWMWSLPSSLDTDLLVGDYRTNQNGEGVWRWSVGRNEWVQSLGTCQFSLVGIKTKSGIRKKINRYFGEGD